MDPQVGDAQDGRRVAHGDAATGERHSGFSGLPDSHAVGVSCFFVCSTGLCDGWPHGLGQHRTGDEVELVFVELELQGGSFANRV